MVKHMVMWKLKDRAEGHDKNRNLRIMKQKLESLPDAIDAIDTLEVGLNVNHSAAAADIVLITTHASYDALQEYIGHPAHKETAAFIGKIVAERRVVDFETE